MSLYRDAGSTNEAQGGALRKFFADAEARLEERRNSVRITKSILGLMKSAKLEAVHQSEFGASRLVNLEMRLRKL